MLRDGIMVITKEAFKELLNNIFNSPDAEKMCEEIFNILDYDGNEYLVTDPAYRLRHFYCVGARGVL